MLIERVFVIGGILCVVLGGGLAWAFASTGWDYFGLLFAGGVSAGFGALFVYVGEGARRQRLDLLALGESGDPNANARPKP